MVILFLYYIIGLSVEDIFYGIDYPEIATIGNVNFRRLVMWIWLYLPLWCTAGYHENQLIKERAFTVYRYRSWGHWYRDIMIDMIMMDGSYLIGLVIAYIALSASNNYLPVILISVHASFGVSLLIFIMLTINSSVFSLFIIILTEFFLFLFGDEFGLNSNVIIPNWGMFIRSGLISEKEAFNIFPVIIFQVALIFILLCCGYYIAKRGEADDKTKHNCRWSI